MFGVHLARPALGGTFPNTLMVYQRNPTERDEAAFISQACHPSWTRPWTCPDTRSDISFLDSFKCLDAFSASVELSPSQTLAPSVTSSTLAWPYLGIGSRSSQADKKRLGQLQVHIRDEIHRRIHLQAPGSSLGPWEGSVKSTESFDVMLLLYTLQHTSVRGTQAACLFSARYRVSVLWSLVTHLKEMFPLLYFS